MAQLTIEQRIRGAAEQNARLLQTLAETDYAVSAYQQNIHYIAGLKKQIAEDEDKVKNLGLAASQEYRDHEKYRDSHLKRLAYKIGGKEEEFEEQATKEEKEWLDAVQSELVAKNELDHLRLDLVRAEETHIELANIATVRNSTQVEMDDLYNRLFEGPTPDVPGEDEKERAVKMAEHNFNARQLQLSNEKQAAQLLRDAGKMMIQAIHALGMSNHSMSNHGMSNYSTNQNNDTYRRRCAEQAGSNVIRTEALVGMAHRLQPLIMPGLRPAKDYDNSRIQPRIYLGIDSLRAAQKRLVAEMHAADEREMNMQAEVDEAKIVLAEKRQELQQIRRSAFESILGQATIPDSVDALPSYEGEGILPEYTAEGVCGELRLE